MDIEVRVYSIAMTEEERKRWKSPDAICPVCKERFGGWKQARVCETFPNNKVAEGTIIHKKCVSHNKEE